MKICPVAAHLFYPDGQTERQTDMKMLIVSFRNFANAPKILFNIIILSTYTPSKWSISFRFHHQNTVYVSHFSHPYHMPRQFDPPLFYHRRNTYYEAPYCAVFSNFVLFAPHEAQITSSIPCARTPSTHVLEG